MKSLIFLLAVSAFAQLTERDLKFVKQPPMTGTIGIPRSYALVVGIAEYAKLPPKGQLKFPARDAAAVYASLISPEGGQFPPENVHRLIGKQATLANLRKELEEWLPSVSKDGDRVVIYFAGHGFVSNGQAYLAPYDIDLADIPGSSYAMTTLGQVVGNKIKAKWKVLLTDACHSGAITPEADASRINGSLTRLDQSLFSLTASRDREQSFESDIWGGGHGVFTYYVMKAIEGEADDNRDGVVTADELAEYVRVNVRRETSAKQNPTAERGSFDPNMILAYNPGRAPSGPVAAPKFGGLVVEANMDGVEIFVDGKSQGTINKDKPLRLPGLLPGVHTVKGVRMGYEPDGPREETVYPGQETTVTLRITIARRRTKAALDAFDEGLELYQKGYEKNYRAAAVSFERALAMDAKYSQAALYLGRVYNALFESEKAKAAFELAIAIDPDYAEAQSSYGGMLLDLGALDESIRQLNASVVKEPGNSLTNSLLAQAFIRKGALAEGERFARESIRLNAGHAEAHFWLAEGLRFGKQCPEARREYAQYLRLSDFDSKLAGKLNYYVLGYLAGMGKKKRAAQADIWRELQFMAHFGLCDCARMSKEFDAAISSCQQALSLDGSDLFAHYALGVTYAEKFNSQKNPGLLAAAKTHFETVVKLNPEAQEADKAKKYVANINQVLVALGNGVTN
ncbi:MAG: caspase family protein [Bryobacteraceae bacterium]|nr:caspase family protein [Bryobacteraceae bacterium]